MLSLWMEGLWHIFWLLGTSASVCFGLLQMRKHFVSQLWPLGHWTAQNETVIYLWPEKYREKRTCLSSLMFRALIAILDIETGVLICNIMSNDLHETVSGGATGTHPCSWVTALNNRVPTSVLCFWQHLCFFILCKSPDQERVASVLPATKSMTVKWPAYSREDMDSTLIVLLYTCEAIV